MAALTIRNMDESTKQSLRVLAAQHGVSMEEEARRILRDALGRSSQPDPLGERLKQRFAEVSDVDFQLPARQMPRTPPHWGEAPAK